MFGGMLSLNLSIYLLTNFKYSWGKMEATALNGEKCCVIYDTLGLTRH